MLNSPHIRELLSAFFILFYFVGCGNGNSQPRDTKPEMLPIQLQYQAKADRFMVKDDSIRRFFEIASTGIRFYDSPRDQLLQNPEFELYWEEVDSFQKLSRLFPFDTLVSIYRRKGTRRLAEIPLPPPVVHYPMIVAETSMVGPLTGYRIAIDPGHVGGSMEYAKKERKYIHMASHQDSSGKEIAFNEGNLTLATAFELKKLLTAQGAEVILTRTQKGKSAFGLSYAEWQGLDMDSILHYFVAKYELTGEDSTFWFEEANETRIHRSVFKLLEFERRADIINDFHPDLTIVIHYNVEESNEPDRRTKLHSPTDKNFNMAFVAGSWMKGELDFLPWRVEFLLKLINDDIERSVDFSKLVVDELVLQTGVPAIAWDDSLRYLNKASMPTGEQAVFARNLAMNRQIQGVMCFGESLYQDNFTESQRLNKRDYTIAGMQTSSRIKDVARAYFNAVMRYFHP